MYEKTNSLIMLSLFDNAKVRQNVCPHKFIQRIAPNLQRTLPITFYLCIIFPFFVFFFCFSCIFMHFDENIEIICQKFGCFEKKT